MGVKDKLRDLNALCISGAWSFLCTDKAVNGLLEVPMLGVCQ
jgi:hypothetical protein